MSVDVSSLPPSAVECMGEGEGSAAGKRQAPAGYALSAGMTPPPRDRGEAHPDRVSHLRNVVTPLRSRRISPGRPTARKGRNLSVPAWNRQRPGSRIADGIPPRVYTAYMGKNGG